MYHNHVHAADTTLGVAHFLLRGDIAKYLRANSTLRQGLGLEWSMCSSR